MRRSAIGLAVTFSIVAISLFTFVTAGAAPVQDQAPVSVQFSGAIESGGGAVDYNITVVNNSSSPISNLYVTGTVPEGTKFASASATPSGATFKAVEDGAAAWVAGTIPAGGKMGPFSYKVNVTEAPAGAAHAWIHWTAPSDGTAQTADVTWQAAIEAGGPRRGCLSCHTLIDPATGKYTLGFEANERTKVDYGVGHPVVAPDGTSVAPNVESSVTACLQCHKPSPTSPDRGVGAPITLRDIVHPAHMFSETFTGHYGGNCFTCHDVNGEGDFELLGDHVVTNEKGVPRSLEKGQGSIPGAIPPSEDSK